MSAGYKPSPLGYGSPRSSPFRRPESPASPTAARHTTPTPSPTKTTMGSGSNTNASFAFARSFAAANASSDSPAPLRTTRTATSPTTPSHHHKSGSSISISTNVDGAGDVFASSTYSASSATHHQRQQPSLGSPAQFSSSVTSSRTAIQQTGNALSQLQPTQVRTLRDGFQILDRDGDGVVNKDDVADMLNQLGLPSTPRDLAAFFPSGSQQTMTLAVFLNSIASTLAHMSDGAEMLSAFSAFDDDDSGQVDLAELRDALLHTAPEDFNPGGGVSGAQRAPTAAEVDKVLGGFSGRRAFSRNSHHQGGAPTKRGEVFKYQNFVNSIVGGNNGKEEGNGNEAAEA